jgi:hypothetical protein
MYVQWQRMSIFEMNWQNKATEHASDSVAKYQEQLLFETMGF